MIENSNVRTQVMAWIPSLVRLSGRAGGAALALALSAPATGCSPRANGDVSETATLSEGLGSDDWRNWSTLFTAGFDYYEDPGVCSNVRASSTVAVLRDSDRKYWLRNVVQYQNSDWALFDGREFVSPPACAMLSTFPYSSTNPNHMLVSGKGTDNRIYVLVGTIPIPNWLNPSPPAQTFNNPPIPSPWNRLSSTTYPSGEGHPAVASSGTRSVVVFRARSNLQQRIHVHNRANPFGAWSARLTAPGLPSGVIPVGTPTITFIANASNDLYDNKFVIMSRTQTGGLVWALYDGQNTFTDLTPGPDTNYWGEAFVPFSLVSDPAVEWDPEQNFLTVYYMTLTGTPDGGPRILNTTVPDPGSIGAYPSWFIDPSHVENPTFLGSPKVTMGGGRESARRMPVIRGYTNTNQGEELNQVVLSVEDLPVNYLPPASPWE
jgi:hypothetical protein